MIIFRFLEKPMNLVHVLCFILIFQNVECQCTGGYTAVLGDILGWGSVNGFGAGQIVASCSECIALCDQQGPACLSTECSPSTLQCNLNAHSNVDTTTSFGDFSFCVKPTGNDFMILNALFYRSKINVRGQHRRPHLAREYMKVKEIDNLMNS